MTLTPEEAARDTDAILQALGAAAGPRPSVEDVGARARRSKKTLMAREQMRPKVARFPAFVYDEGLSVPTTQSAATTQSHPQAPIFTNDFTLHHFSFRPFSDLRRLGRDPWATSGWHRDSIASRRPRIWPSYQGKTARPIRPSPYSAAKAFSGNRSATA